MPDKKHYVYSARTTEKGLALLNKTKGNDQSWDTFISKAVAAYYKLEHDAIALPPSEFLAKQAAGKAAKEAEKAARKAEREAKAAAKAKADKAKKASAEKAKDKKAPTKKAPTKKAPVKKAGTKPTSGAVVELVAEELALVEETAKGDTEDKS